MEEKEKKPGDVTRFPGDEAPEAPSCSPLSDTAESAPAEAGNTPASAESAPTEASNTPAPTEAPPAPNDGTNGENTPERVAKNPNRKKLIALIATAGAVLLILAAVLISNTVRDRRPPALDDIRARVEELVLASREVNEIFFGEGLPVYARVYMPEFTLGKYPVTYKAKTYKRSYYTFTDRDGRRMLKYQYCLAAGFDTNEDGTNDRYEYPDLEFGGLLTVNEVNDYRYAEMFLEEPESWDFVVTSWIVTEVKNTADEEGGATDEEEVQTEDVTYWIVKDSSGEVVFQSGEPGDAATKTHWLVKCNDYEEPFYYSTEDDAYYDYVTEDCPYQSTEELKALAEQVYSSEYLLAISESVFTGVTVSDRDSGTLLARYVDMRMEDGYSYLMQSNSYRAMNVKRVFDFSTMTMAKSSNSTYVTVEMETYLEGHEEERLVVRVSLVLEDGRWMLDSPTY